MLSSHTTAINDSPVHYLSSQGTNNHTILILHGRGGSCVSRKEVGEGLATLGYTVIIPDLPGFGQTPLPHPFTIDDYAQRVKKFIVQGEFIIYNSKFIILGHSNGGRIATYAIAHNILTCDYLILNNAAGIAPLSRAPRRKYSWGRIRGLFLVSKTLVFRAGKAIISHIPFGSLFRKFFYRLIGAHDYLVAEKNPNLKQTFLNMLQAVFPDELYQNITVPTLVLRGEHDTYTPLRMGQKIASLLPYHTLVICKNQKHGIHLADPQKVVNEVHKFIFKNL